MQVSSSRHNLGAEVITELKGALAAKGALQTRVSELEKSGLEYQLQKELAVTRGRTV